jgi:hypothetical protein
MVAEQMRNRWFNPVNVGVGHFILGRELGRQIDVSPTRIYNGFASILPCSLKHDRKQSEADQLATC